MLVARALLAVAGGLVAAPAVAAVVVDPVPDIQPGVTVGIQSFVTIPASDPGAPSRARIQYVTPAYDGSDRLFVNDQRGTLWLTNTAGAAPTSYLNIAAQGVGFTVPSGEGGFLGIAFHPNFNGDASKAGYSQFYTHYSATVASGVATYLDDPANDHDNVIREWTVADPAALVATVTGSREIIRVGHFASNHNGGTIGFNPTAAEGSADYGKLYIGFGDGGGGNDPRNYGQNLTVPLGKVLRIDPTDPDGAGPLSYTVPGDNPFVGQAGTLAEIYATGLRNPQQFSWDPVTGALYISDIGQAQLEEVNLGRAGANYGWVTREGTFAKSPDKANSQVFDTPANDGRFDDPIAQYDHDEGDAIGGGFLYRGSLIPELVGKFVLTDITTGRLFYFDPAAATPGSTATMLELLLTLDGQPFTFLAAEGYGGNRRVDLRLGTDEDGELYLLTKRDGDIYRFVASAAPVPEPATWAMMIAGFALVGVAARRRPLVRA